MRSWTRLAGVLAALLLVVSLAGVTAPARADGDGGLLLVMDSSGSMAEPTDDGTPRIDAAKEALNTVVDQADDSLALGMRVYGASVFDQSDPGACTDSDLVVPIGTGNRDQLRTAIGGYQPYGETPIAHALTEAGKDLGDTGQRSILLVSDGEETCVPDPCPVAEKLAAQGIDLSINVVGLNVTGTARDQLSCIAEKGNGQYFDASNTQELVDSLTTVATRVGQEYEGEGDPVTGSPNEADAPEITEGSYTDTLRANEPRYYRIKRYQEGSTIWVGALSQNAAGNFSQTLSVSLYAEDGTRCGRGSAIITNYKDAAALDAATAFTEANPTCGNGPVLVEVEPSRGADEVPVQLNITEEPPAANPGSLPEPVEPGVAWEPMDTTAGTGDPIRGGTSLASAPELEPGSTVPVTLVPGEVQLFAVQVPWGQRLQSQLTGTLAKGSGLESVKVDVLNPLGSTVNQTIEGGPSAQTVEDVDLGAATAEVRYRNREASDSSVQTTALSDRYYVAISLGGRGQAGSEGTESELQLTTGLVGEPGGAPSYLEVQVPKPPITGPRPPTAAPTPAPGEQGGGDSGDQPEGGANWPLIGGLGGGAVVLAAVGGILVWRLRRS